MNSRVDHAALTTAVLVLVLGAGTGCASSRIPDERPRALTEVNEQLDERWARIRRTDGRLFEGLENVQVGPDSTTYYHRFDQAHRTLPTASVRTVQLRGETGSGTGFLIGAAPGIVATFMGGAIAATHSEGESIGSGIAAGLGLVMAAGGAVVGLVGGTIGAIIGGDSDEDEWVTMYEGPITRYQRSPAATQRPGTGGSPSYITRRGVSATRSETIGAQSAPQPSDV